MRVMQGLQDFGGFREGDVLVAKATAPAWTPLFARAAGVVTDGGSIAAHASRVAREYGIPAVVATGNATVRLYPGQLVTVDGSAGTITPHTEPITHQRDGQRVESDHAYVADGNVALAHPLP
jgi:pyruvate,water dikinase